MYVVQVFFLSFGLYGPLRLFHSFWTELLGGAKTGNPWEKLPDHPQAELGLSHMWTELGLNPQWWRNSFNMHPIASKWIFSSCYGKRFTAILTNADRCYLSSNTTLPDPLAGQTWFITEFLTSLIVLHYCVVKDSWWLKVTEFWCWQLQEVITYIYSSMEYQCNWIFRKKRKDLSWLLWHEWCMSQFFHSIDRIFLLQESLMVVRCSLKIPSQG